MSDDELKRQCRLADQMLSMYSILRDRYERRALYLTLGILGSSVILCACTFLPEDALEAVGITALSVKIIIGAFSSLVLFLSIIELRVDWKKRAQGYADAAEALARWRSNYRNTIAQFNPLTADKATALLVSYAETLENRPRIPDSEFHRLKALHLRKVEISRMIDAAPGCPVVILRLRLFWKGIRAKSRP